MGRVVVGPAAGRLFEAVFWWSGLDSLLGVEGRCWRAIGFRELACGRA